MEFPGISLTYKLKLFTKEMMDDYLLGDRSLSLHPKYQFLNGNLENNIIHSYDKGRGKNIKVYHNLKTFIAISKLKYFFSGIYESIYFNFKFL